MPCQHELDYERVREAIESADTTELELVKSEFPKFPAAIFHDILHDALDVSSKDVTIWLIENGADVNFKDAGYSPLHIAIERRCSPLVLNKLIEFGADINLQGIHDWTPLHMAAFRRHYRAMEILLDAGADIGIRTRIDNYATAAEEAKRFGHQKSVALIENYLNGRTET